MKLFALLLLIAVLGKVNSMPRQGPYVGNRQVLYRMEDESEEEDDDIQDDNNDEESSEEVWVNDPNPPSFSKLFPTAPLEQQEHRKQQGAPGPNSEAILAIQQEIQQTGWKNASPNHRLRTLGRAGGDFQPRWRAYRSDDSSEEDDDEDEEEEEERRLPFDEDNSLNLGPGPQNGPPPQARRFPGNYRRYRAGISPSGQPVYLNRPPVSYAPRQPFYAVSPGRGPVRYTYVPSRQLMSYPPSRVQGPMRYPQPQSHSRPVVPSYNRAPAPVSYAPRPPVSYAQRPPVSYSQRPPVSYAQRPGPPISYSQRPPVSVYNNNRRQFYQVPVAMSLPVRRYKSSPVHSSQNYYRGPVGLRRQRQYNRYY